MFYWLIWVLGSSQTYSSIYEGQQHRREGGKELQMKINLEITVGDKRREYSVSSADEALSLLTKMKVAERKDLDFEPDEVFAHQSCSAAGGCSLPTLECYFGFPKYMPDMPQYGKEFMSALIDAEVEKRIDEMGGFTLIVGKRVYSGLSGKSRLALRAKMDAARKMDADFEPDHVWEDFMRDRKKRGEFKEFKVPF
jgi:hypothetical protein